MRSSATSVCPSTASPSSFTTRRSTARLTRAGPVSARTADELARIDAGYQFGADGRFPFRGLGGVSGLRDLLERFPAMPVIIEVKGDRPEVGARVVDVARETKSEQRVIVAGFSRVVLDHVRAMAPDLPTGALEPGGALGAASIVLRPVAQTARVWIAPGAVPSSRSTDVRSTFVRAARRGHVPVFVWVIDDPADIRLLLGWGVTGIISDRPDIALREIQG